MVHLTKQLYVLDYHDATWRMLYGGVQPSKSTTKQITDTCGMLEAYSEVDKDLVKLSNDPVAFRATEDSAFVESMGQEIARTLFYGDETTPEKFIGLSPRFNTLDVKKADSAKNIIDAGGTANLAIYVARRLGPSYCTWYLSTWQQGGLATRRYRRSNSN